MSPLPSLNQFCHSYILSLHQRQSVLLQQGGEAQVQQKTKNKEMAWKADEFVVLSKTDLAKNHDWLWQAPRAAQERPHLTFQAQTAPRFHQQLQRTGNSNFDG